MNNNIVIGTSAILITFNCNLKCKLCCTMTPIMKKEKQIDFPLTELKSVLKQYFEIIKYIRKLSFGGGEPTLYKQLPELIEYAVGFKNKIEILEIITNGTVIPSDDVLYMVERYKDIVFFMIDNYGNKISKNADTISEIFRKRGIRHSVRCYHGENAHCGGWVDLGNFSHKHSSEQAKRLLKRCTSGKFKNNTGNRQENILINNHISENTFFINYAANTNGLIHRCARAYSSLQSGALPDTNDCFVNIMDRSKTIGQIRQEIITMFSSDRYLACEFCNGFDDTSKRYQPAEQI